MGQKSWKCRCRARPPFCSDILRLGVTASPLCAVHNGHFFLFFGRTSLASLHPKHSEHLLLLWTVVPWNCHPCCGDGRMVSSSGLFSQLGLCMDRSKEVSLSQGNSSTWCWVWLSCFPPPLLCNSPATVLASSPSCAPLMDRLGCLTFLPHP